MSQPPALTSLIFPTSHHGETLSQTLTSLKRHTLSIHNHLTSILHDSAFILSLPAHYPHFPLIANERCGSWYLPPTYKHANAYFKSTDGHTSQWNFNTRRLNLHLLQTIGQKGGVVIIDSTRRGKRIPDAQSKTIPIWACVLNRAFWPEAKEWHALYVPGNVVSELERAQIEARLEGFVRDFLALGLDLKELRNRIGKPMRPFWITPESVLPDVFVGVEGWCSIVCCTASRRVVGAEVSEGGYIQGAGDDTENWAYGLTPTIFWENKDLLIGTEEVELPVVIDGLMEKTRIKRLATGAEETLIKPTKSLFLTTFSNTQTTRQGCISINLKSEVTPSTEWQKSTTQMDVGIGTGKVGSRNLRAALPIIVSHIKKCLSKSSPVYPDIVVSCVTGKDFSVGLTLALLCVLYDDKGEILGEDSVKEGRIDKLFIKQRLVWITSSVTDANPSRSTLQSVNSYLMERT